MKILQIYKELDEGLVLRFAAELYSTKVSFLVESRISLQIASLDNG